MKTMLTTAAVLLTLSATNLQASTAKILAFGDSLLDSGNLDLALRASMAPDVPLEKAGINSLPPPPNAPPRTYPLGQFTNGNTWTTKLGLVPSLLGGTNFGYGGATAVRNDDTIPDLKAQIRDFLRSGLSVDSNTTAAIWVGGNDFRAFDPGWTEKQTNKAVRRIVRNIAKGVKRLYKAGVSNIVVLGLPEIDVLPDSVTKYNTKLSRVLSRLDHRLPNSDIDYYDINGLFQQILIEASQTRTLSQFPCIYDPVGCAAAPENYVLYDEIHPSAWVHQILAQEIADDLGLPTEVSAVPLPASAWMLLASLGGFGLWAHRRRSRA